MKKVKEIGQRIVYVDSDGCILIDSKSSADTVCAHCGGLVVPWELINHQAQCKPLNIFTESDRLGIAFEYGDDFVEIAKEKLKC